MITNLLSNEWTAVSCPERLTRGLVDPLAHHVHILG